MNKHLQQPDSMGAPPTTGHHSEQLSGPGKKHAVHGPSTQSTFKTDPNLHSQQHSQQHGSINAEAKKQYHNAHKKSSGSHAQKADHN
ncbi:hypothetical protein BGZ70_009376, partial [Mortierella alpina]